MESHLKTIVTIAVRMKSKRLPKKAMVLLKNKPLLHHLVERVREAKQPHHVVVCTSCLDEDRILVEEAKKCGVPALAGNPENVFERFLDAAQQLNADHVVRVTGDNPLTDPVVMDQLIQHHLASGADYTTMDGLPLGVASEVIAVTALKKAQNDLKDKARSEYMTFILRDPSKYHVQILEADEKIRRPKYRLTVDTPADLELMRFIFNGLCRPDTMYSLEEVVRFLDQHPEKASLNQSIEQRSTFDA